MPKRRVLLVDDEVTVLLTLKAVLEISGFDVDTAASAREGRSKIKLHEYQMVITDMRMESDAAGREVIQAARHAAYHPAVALLTAFPDDDWADMGADKMLVKPMQTAILIRQIEALLDSHATKLQRLSSAATAPAKKAPAKKSAAKRLATKTVPTKTTAAPAKKSAAPKIPTKTIAKKITASAAKKAAPTKAIPAKKTVKAPSKKAPKKR